MPHASWLWMLFPLCLYEEGTENRIFRQRRHFQWALSLFLHFILKSFLVVESWDFFQSKGFFMCVVNISLCFVGERIFVKKNYWVLRPWRASLKGNLNKKRAVSFLKVPASRIMMRHLSNAVACPYLKILLLVVILHVYIELNQPRTSGSVCGVSEWLVHC